MFPEDRVRRVVVICQAVSLLFRESLNEAIPKIVSATDAIVIHVNGIAKREHLPINRFCRYLLQIYSVAPAAGRLHRRIGDDYSGATNGTHREH